MNVNSDNKYPMGDGELIEAMSNYLDLPTRDTNLGVYEELVKKMTPKPDTITVTMPLEQAMRILDGLEAQRSMYYSFIATFPDDEAALIYGGLIKEIDAAKKIIGEATSEATKDL